MKRIRFFLTLFALITVQFVFAQSRTVTGVVTSEEGETLPGVSVVVKGTTNGTVTGNDGAYSIEMSQGAKILIFSFIGLESKEVTVDGTTADVVMVQSAVDVDEVMVVAYGTATKESFTGSASVVDNKTLEKRQVSNVSQALTGVAAGVQSTSSTGQPGTSAKIRIRGIGSLNASSSPLYVVDGVPFGEDISSISPQDIESISVLKDAASASLYGARGANGVILITTKKGAKGETKVTIDAKFGVNQRGVPEYDIMTDPAMYYEKFYEGIYNNQLGAGLSPSEANPVANELMFGNQGLEYNIYNVPDGQLLIDESGKINPSATLGTVYQNDYYLTNDDWYGELFGDNNYRQEYSLSLSGGTEKQTTYMSLNYLSDKGIVSNSGYDRLTARIKSNYEVNKYIKVDGNIGYTHYNSLYPSDQSGLSSKNIFYVSRIVAPIYPLYVRDNEGNVIVDEQGHTLYDYGTGEYPGLTRPVMSIANPASDLQLDKQKYVVDVLNSRGRASLTFIEGLKADFVVGYDVDNTRYLDKSNAYYGQSADFGGNVYQMSAKNYALTLSQLLTYNKDINNHSLNVLVGHETYDRKTESLYGLKYNLYDPESEEVSNGILRPSTGSSSNGYVVEGYLSRIQYDYFDKYYLSASYRRDGSSVFAEDNRWGNFWSVGGSWLLHEESFMSFNFVDFLKLKASYGVQGNDQLLNQSGYFVNQAYSDKYEVSNSNDDFALELVYKGNPDITWESSYNLNAGLEFTLFNNVLDGSVEFFNRRVEDMLYYVPVPSSAGYSSYPDNIGSMRNRGFEFSLDADVIKTKDISWNISVNGTTYKNEILSLPDQFSDPDGYVTGRKILRVGGSIYDTWYPVYAGVNKETGASQWRIVEEDGSYGVTEDYGIASEKENSASQGTTLPDLSGGFGTEVEAFGFDLSLNFSYSLGGLTYDYVYQLLMHGGSAGDAGDNWHKDILNSWTPTNTDSDIPMVDFGGKDVNSTSDRFLVSASYLSLNNVTLGYTLPKSLLKKYEISSVRVYGTADNVALFSARQGLDPRQNFSGGTGFIYSPIRTISAGLKINF